jgi:hypothetical protein
MRNEGPSPREKESIMTNPSSLTPGPDHAVETTSASPAIHLGPAKAIIAAVAGFAVAVGPVLATVLGDGAIDVNEGILLLVAALAGLGIPGVGTYIVPTRVTVDPAASTTRTIA